MGGLSIHDSVMKDVHFACNSRSQNVYTDLDRDVRFLRWTVRLLLGQLPSCTAMLKVRKRMQNDKADRRRSPGALAFNLSASCVKLTFPRICSARPIVSTNLYSMAKHVDISWP